MHFNLVAAVALGLVPSVLSCRQFDDQGNQMDCEWFGSSPGCGGTGSNIGDTDNEGRILWQWTKDNDWATFCDPQADRPHNYGHSVSSDCCNAYGAGCWSGYKRLWCRK